ncbi:hypothetical protein QQ045_022194 [Rhodiola kirilowii]
MKLSSLSLRHQISKWVYPSASMSSISSAKHISSVHESDPKPSIEKDIEPKIASLKNSLAPETLIKVLESTTEVNSAVKIFKWASSQRLFYHNADTYCSIISKLGMSGCVDEMEWFCNELLKEKCLNGKGVFVAVISCFVEHCRLVEATRVFTAMVAGGCKPAVNTVNVLLGALVNAKRELGEVLFVYKEMVKAGTLPNVDTLNYLIEALCEAGRVDLALDQYKRMGKKGLVPNSVTYRILICSFVKKGKVHDSVIILNEMLSSGCGVDFGFCASVVPLFARLSKVDEAMKVFRKMRELEIQPALGIFEVLLPCLVENMWLDDAVILSHEMLESGMTLDKNVVVDIVKRFCDSGRFDDANKYVEDFSLTDVSVHNALLEGYCNVENLKEAMCLFDSIFRRHIVDDLSWNILARFLADIGLTRKANEIICRMIVSSFVPNTATYCSLIVGNCRLSRFREAFYFCGLMREKNWVMDLNSYAVLIEGLCKGEMILEATDVFHYMSKERHALESSSLDILISSLCAKSMVDEVVRLQTSSYHFGTGWTSAAYDTIMLALLKQNKASEVLNVFSLMLVEGVAPSVEAHHILLNGMILQDKPTKCTRLFTRMVDAGMIPDSETLSKLISCLVNHDQLHTISGKIDSIVSSGDFLDSPTFNMLVRGLLKEGYNCKASHSLDLMLERGWVPDAQTHAMLIGSNANPKGNEKISTFSNNPLQDNVDSILIDSLG